MGANQVPGEPGTEPTGRAMEAVYAWLVALARPRVIALGVVWLVVMNTLVFPPLVAVLVEASGGPGLLDLRFGYGAAEVHATLEAFGAIGRRQSVLIHCSADLIYPAGIALLLSLSIVSTLRGLGRYRGAARRLCLVPLAFAASDYLENASLVGLALSFPDESSGLVAFASLCTRTKWVLVGGSLGILGMGAVGWLAGKVGRG